MRFENRFITVSLSAVLHKGKIRIHDINGLPISKWFDFKRCAPASNKALERVKWQERIKAMLSRASYHASLCNAGPWYRRAESMACSFKLRKGQVLRWRGSKRQLDYFSTTTWENAARRLYIQGKNASRRHDQTGWVLWAHTVSNNHDKRAKDKNEMRKLRDSKTASGTPSETELYLSNKRTRTDT